METGTALFCLQAKASRHCRERLFHKQKLPDIVGKNYFASKSFATPSGRISSQAKASRHRREGLFREQKLPDIVGKDYFASKNPAEAEKGFCLRAKINKQER